MEKKIPSISIIIPTYNVENYIVECLQSIAAQTYKGDIECIIVDDCSTDNSRSVISDWLNKYEGKIYFKTIWQKENQRQGVARNTGVKNASGEYVIFVDSDDYISSKCLEVMVNILEQHPDSDYVLCGMKDVNGHICFVPKAYPKYSNDYRWLMSMIMRPEEGIPPGPVNKLIRKSLIVDNNIYFPSNVIYEDVEFSFLLGIYAKSACFCQDITYIYRTNREGSTITTVSKDVKFAFHSRLVILENLLKRCVGPYRNIQVGWLLCRFILYVRMTDIKTLLKYSNDIACIQKYFLSTAKGYMYFVIWIYFKLSFSIQKKALINKLMYKYLQIKMFNYENCSTINRTW